MKSPRLASLALVVPLAVACSGSSSPSGQPTGTASSKPSAASSPAKEDLVASFTGTTSSTTRTFAVKAGWELRYEITTGQLAVDLIDTSGKSLGQLAKGKGPAGGSVYPKQVGTYSLKVTASGKYLVRVFNH